MDSIDRRCAVPNESFTGHVEHAQRLLGFAFDCNKSHRRTTGCFTNGFGVGVVVLVTFDIRSYMLRGNQFGLMTTAGCESSHEMSASTGLHGQGAGW
ncbi:hypothetical protein D3C81_1494820 [compost metagenome]